MEKIVQSNRSKNFRVCHGTGSYIRYLLGWLDAADFVVIESGATTGAVEVQTFIPLGFLSLIGPDRNQSRNRVGTVETKFLR